jgi:hypothetical protein
MKLFVPNLCLKRENNETLENILSGKFYFLNLTMPKVRIVIVFSFNIITIDYSSIQFLNRKSVTSVPLLKLSWTIFRKRNGTVTAQEEL